MNEVIVTAIITGLLISILFGLLGSLVLWKKYTYFGDGLAHASLLGIIIAGFCPIYLTSMIVTICAICFAGLIYILSENHNRNSIIGVISHSFLALAIIINSKNPGTSQVTNYLFGDILAISHNELIMLSLITIIVIIWWMISYRKITIICLNPEIACSIGIKTILWELSVLLILALVIATTIKVIGALLVTALLLIPAAIARLISNTPQMMVITAIIISLVINHTGLFLSFCYDIPTSPTVIVLGAGIFIIIRIFAALLKKPLFNKKILSL